MNRLTPIFLFLSVALVIWGASVVTSNYLAGSYEREHKATAHQKTATQAPVSGMLSELREKASANPKNLEDQLQLGYAVFSTAVNNGDGSMLMEAVKAFKTALDISPDNPDALLGLASLCLQAGITDKAMEYYPRYLKLRPNDKRAKTDFALVNFKSDNFEKGKAIIDEVLKEDPNFFQAYMTMAFAYRAKGDIANAKAQAQLAKANTSDPKVKGEIDTFFTSVASGKVPKPITQPNVVDNVVDNVVAKGVSSNESPEAIVESYVKNHSIIGPKLRAINWKSDSIVEVSLEDFPVEQMPPFAKQIFLTKAAETLKSLGKKVDIVLIDSKNSKELLVIPVGE